MELRELFQSPLPSIPTEYRRTGPLVLGLVGWFAALGTYKIAGFGWGVAAVWIWSIAIFGLGIKQLDTWERTSARISSRDILAVLLLLGMFAPLYLVDLYSLPYPVHNDEVELMILETAHSVPGADLFGISQYLSMPIFLFSAFGWAGRAIGEIELTTMRAVHASLGLLIIAVGYGLFRLSATRSVAFGAALIVGVNHSLWMLSRMALWDNSALLIELVALAFLVQALRTRSPLLAFIGGVFVGLGFYFCIPARVTVALWALLIVALALFFRKKIEIKPLITMAAVSAVGCILMVTPLFMTNTRISDQYTSSYRFLFTEEGLEHQRLHALGSLGEESMSTFEGFLVNVRHGLTAFNSQVWDGGGMYRNPHAGFTDPLTGALVWIGLISVVLSWRRRNLPRFGDLLAVISFISLLFVLAFVINQAPNFARMLIVLPFAAYLAAKGLDWFSNAMGRLAKSKLDFDSDLIKASIFAGGILIIGFWNFKIVGDYIQFAWEEGDIRGATARYILARSDEPDMEFFVVANSEYPYYDWGDPEVWMDWASFFADPDHELEVTEPADFLAADLAPPFVAFMSARYFKIIENDLTANFPGFSIQEMLPDGSVIAMETH